MSKKISFTELYFTINEQAPAFDDFTNTTSNKNPETFENIAYKLYVNKTKQYIYMSFICCNTKSAKYSKLVFNTSTHSDESNLNSFEKIPYDCEFFFIFYFIENTFYISNTQKTTFLEKFLSFKNNTNCIIKKVIDFDQLISTMSKISEINLCSKSNDLLDDDGNKVSNLINDTFGLGESDQINLSLKYSNCNVTNKFKSFYERFRKVSNKKLIVIGKDDKNIDLIFNNEFISRPVNITIDKEHIKNGFCDMYNVKSKLLIKLGIQ